MSLFWNNLSYLVWMYVDGGIRGEGPSESKDMIIRKSLLEGWSRDTKGSLEGKEPEVQRRICRINL